MVLFAWRHGLKRGQATGRPRPGTQGRPRPYRPRVEALEERLAPATFTVTNLDDTGSGSLRAEIALANSSPASSTILFDPTLAGGTVVLSSVGDSTAGPSALVVNSPITIAGTGQFLTRGIIAQRLFLINSSGILTLQNLTLLGGSAEGGKSFYGGGAAGLGGGIFNFNGALNLDGCTMRGNLAAGGASADPVNGGGVGGGGLGGDANGNNGGPPNPGANGGGNGGFGGGGGFGNPFGGSGGFGGGGGLGSASGGNGGFGGGGGGTEGGGGFSGLGGFGAGGGGGGNGFIGGGGGGAGMGGAIFNLAGNVTVTNSTLSGNTARGGSSGDNGGNGGGGGSGMGGAFFNVAGTVTLTNATLTGNSAVGGTSSIANDGGSAQGGALFNLDGTMTVTDCTVAENSVNGGQGGTAGGGALWSLALDLLPLGVGFSGTAASVTLANSILAGTIGGTDVVNEQGGFLGGVPTGTANLRASLPNLIEQPAAEVGQGALFNTTGVFSAAPMLGSLQANGGLTQTLALLPNSPALSAGSAAGGPATDQRGTARDAAPDLGAYEVQHPLSPVGVPIAFADLYAPHPNATATDAYVRGLYQATLLRAPDAAGLAFWSGQLSSGRASRAQVAGGFYNSNENRSNQVTFFYRYFLSREPDAPGLAYHVGRLQSGVDEADVMQGFLLSPEYTGNNGDTAFVNTMYYSLLGRSSEAGGFAYWDGLLLTNQATRQQVALSFIRSAESVNRVVRSDYQAYLKRPASTSEATDSRASIQAGANFGSVAVTVLGSDEFFANASLNTP